MTARAPLFHRGAARLPEGKPPKDTSALQVPQLRAPFLIKSIDEPLKRVLVRGVLVAKVVPQAGESGRAHAAERVAVCAV